jgi:hypothetical protein
VATSLLTLAASLIDQNLNWCRKRALNCGFTTFLTISKTDSFPAVSDILCLPLSQGVCHKLTRSVGLSVGPGALAEKAAGRTD